MAKLLETKMIRQLQF